MEVPGARTDCFPYTTHRFLLIASNNTRTLEWIISQVTNGSESIHNCDDMWILAKSTRNYYTHSRRGVRPSSWIYRVGPSEENGVKRKSEREGKVKEKHRRRMEETGRKKGREGKGEDKKMVREWRRCRESGSFFPQ